jgi:hypothetical protein
MRGGLTGAEIRERGIGAVAAGGIKSHHQQVAKEGGLKPDELNLTGREGGMKGIHETLKVQVSWMQKSYEALAKMSRGEKVPTKNQEGET